MARRIVTARDQVALLAPWRKTAASLDLPDDSIYITQHEQKDIGRLRQEVLDQDGPAILYNVFSKTPMNSPKFWVARGHDGTIHGVLEGHASTGSSINPTAPHVTVKGLYSSLAAPFRTGSLLLHHVAKMAYEGGGSLRVQDVLNHSRRWWETMGASLKDGATEGSWSSESLAALVQRNPSPQPQSKAWQWTMRRRPGWGDRPGDEGKGEWVDSTSIPALPRPPRLPGSARGLVGPGLRAFLDARRAHTAGHWVP